MTDPKVEKKNHRAKPVITAKAVFTYSLLVYSAIFVPLYIQIGAKHTALYVVLHLAIAALGFICIAISISWFVDPHGSRRIILTPDVQRPLLTVALLGLGVLTVVFSMIKISGEDEKFIDFPFDEGAYRMDTKQIALRDLQIRHADDGTIISFLVTSKAESPTIVDELTFDYNFIDDGIACQGDYVRYSLRNTASITASEKRVPSAEIEGGFLDGSTVPIEANAYFDCGNSGLSLGLPLSLAMTENSTKHLQIKFPFDYSISERFHSQRFSTPPPLAEDAKDTIMLNLSPDGMYQTVMLQVKVRQDNGEWACLATVDPTPLDIQNPCDDAQATSG
jgi:hypothetical protein